MSEHVTRFSRPAFSASNREVLIDLRITDAQRGSVLHELIAHEIHGPFAYLYHLRLPDIAPKRCPVNDLRRVR